MTNEEMYKMRQNGATYKQIADVAGMTPPNVANRIMAYLQRQAGARGKGFNIETIRYKGIYEYFANNYYLSIAEFCRKAFGKENAHKAMNMRNLLMGKHNMFFTIDQIKAICELIGKPFEYVFEKRETE